MKPSNFFSQNIGNVLVGEDDKLILFLPENEKIRTAAMKNTLCATLGHYVDGLNYEELLELACEYCGDKWHTGFANGDFGFRIYMIEYL
jgi:hypothetical protein